MSYEYPKSIKKAVSRTVQDHREMVDLSAIMRKHGVSGISRLMINKKESFYGDFTSGNDFTEVNTKIAEAKTAFEMLPPELRTKKFENKVENWIDFVMDDKNRQEAIEIGLIEPKSQYEINVVEYGKEKADQIKSDQIAAEAAKKAAVAEKNEVVETPDNGAN